MRSGFAVISAALLFTTPVARATGPVVAVLGEEQSGSVALLEANCSRTRRSPWSNGRPSAGF
jgi:hypothetical protein